jgi:hypothetical protein
MNRNELNEKDIRQKARQCRAFFVFSLVALRTDGNSFFLSHVSLSPIPSYVGWRA